MSTPKARQKAPGARRGRTDGGPGAEVPPARGGRRRSGARRVPGGPARSGKREQNKAGNRAAILAAARDVFTELGFGAATVRDIVRRTALASGTFYNYFPDKDAVFRALLEESEARRVDWVSRVDRSGPPADVLRRSFAAYFEFVTQDRTTFDLLRRNPHTVRAFAKGSTLSDERARLRKILSEDIAAGRMPRVDVEFVAAAMIGSAFEVALCLVERDPPDVEAATRFASDLFIGFFQRTARRDASTNGGRS